MASLSSRSMVQHEITSELQRYSCWIHFPTLRKTIEVLRPCNSGTLARIRNLLPYERSLSDDNDSGRAPTTHPLDRFDSAFFSQEDRPIHWRCHSNRRPPTKRHTSTDRQSCTADRAASSPCYTTRPPNTDHRSSSAWSDQGDGMDDPYYTSMCLVRTRLCTGASLAPHTQS